MKNFEIKLALFRSGIKQWELADRLGVSESKLSRMLRKDLTDDQKQVILEIIKKGEAICR